LKKEAIYQLLMPLKISVINHKFCLIQGLF
jgi:hypothetical protein